MFPLEQHLVKKIVCVLYIEDNPNDYFLVKRHLTQLMREEGEIEYFNLEHSDRVSNGLDRIAKGGIDIVLTDISLPDTSGLEVITRLRNHFPMLPFIALTNAYDKSLGIEVIRQGAQDYILKEELTAPVLGHSIRCAIERKKLEKMKNEFVSTVSHELLTPLTIMKVGLENLSMGAAGPIMPKQKEILSSVFRNIDRLARIIRDILDLSRLEFGQTMINRVGMQLTPLIQQVMTGFHKKEEEKNIIIEENMSNLPDVFADQNLIIQVLNNLLSNACHFARTKITISAQTVGHMVCVYVIDDGPGIAPEDQKKLFNKFVQIDRPEGGQGYKGTGLGLAICREIISQHEGKIWIESDGCNGSQFCFTLPIDLSKGI